MAPRLRVLAGCSPNTMVPITSIVNTGRSKKISSDLFDGNVICYIKGFTDENGTVRDSEYFSREDRQGVTWSIQVQGRFLVPYTADDIMFGNTFDRPLKLPWGTSAVLKFMHYIDSTLEHDLQSSEKPWALSPLIATMPHFQHTRLPSSPAQSSGSEEDSHPKAIPIKGKKSSPPPALLLPMFPPRHSIKDDTSQLYLASNDYLGSDSASVSSGSSAGSPASSNSSIFSTSSKSSRSSTSSRFGMVKSTVKSVGRRKQRGLEEMEFENATQRRSYFSSPKARQAVQFGPKDVITTDFCYGFIKFSPSLTLQLPGGLSFDLMRYWDGQPVRFVCCERKDPNTKNRGDPWGRIFWCVAIEMYDEEEERDID